MEKISAQSMEQVTIGDYRQHVHDYFFSKAGDEERASYEARGITFTNNLHLWFIEESQREIIPGFANPYDYRNRPFGAVIEDFRQNHPDLWQAVRDAASARRTDMNAYAELLQRNDITPEILQEYEDMQRDYSARLQEQSDIVKSQAFDVIAPMMINANLDPLDVCR